MRSLEDLGRHLRRIDGRGYKAYKDIRGAWAAGDLTLYVDHVQGDPFAAPSKVRVRLSQRRAEIPGELFRSRGRRVALSDFLARQVRERIGRKGSHGRGTGKSGLVVVDAGRQEVLERTAVVVMPEWVEARLHVGLPAAGRRVLGREAEDLLCHLVPLVAEDGLCWDRVAREEGRRHVECVENQEAIRDLLPELGLAAFVADGAVLPRRTGVSDLPLPEDEAVPFRSPESLRVTVEVPNPVPSPDGPTRVVTGMGVPEGVTLIVGGGYHGKSTLLRALERGVYPHRPGDGREGVVTRPDAVKIRAEDGRRVERVDISPFINNLPFGRSTTAFRTDDASGSTSQAANIVEAVEMGASVLLLDEDTSATNFMVRDGRMQALVHKECEPITPFLDRVGDLHRKLGISTVLVMGGCGDYFDVADTAVMMRDFLPREVTEEAKRIASEQPTRRRAETPAPLRAPAPREPVGASFDPSRGRRGVKIDAKAVDLILYGREPIDLRGVEQLVDLSQTRAVGFAIHLAVTRLLEDGASLRRAVEAVEEFFDRHGLDALDPFHRPEEHPGDFARPRAFEIAAAINRLRSLRIRQRER